MRTFIYGTLLAALGGSLIGVAGCKADVHDNTINVEDPNLTIDADADVDVDNVEQGASIPVTINADNVYPVAPDATPPPEHEKDAVYFKLFVDDEDSEPVLVTATLKVQVKLSAEIKEGAHKMICRMFKHDGTRTDASFDFDFTVKASGSVTTETPDAG